MSKKIKVSIIVLISAAFILPVIAQQRRGNCRAGYGYREAVDDVMKRLELKDGMVIVDIGAGDGWWSAQMAKHIGDTGIVRAAEVEQSKVDAMKNRWKDVPQLKPYLCPYDGTGLDENTCDLAFISKTYHHLDHKKHIDYLKHLKKVIKPTGRLVIVEAHPSLLTGRGKEHAWMPGLLGKQAEDAGWMLLSYSLLPKSDHFTAIFVQPENFAEQFNKNR